MSSVEDYTDLPFPEWVDQQINAEKWDVQKKATQTTYIDPAQACLPSYFSPREWKKPADVYPEVHFVINSVVWNYSNLIEGNEHLLESAFMRHFISSIGTLEHLGFTDPWKMEGLGAGYVPNTEGVPWRGWHHVYSSCKAGKGHAHNPQVNALGKYIVRLYWMGSWRKVMVDDLLPVDRNNKVLLPIICTPYTIQGKVQNTLQIEMWPYLLCKALLKIASLTWNDEEDLVDFDVISLLTGWLVHKVNTADSEFIDVWELCTAYSDHFMWAEETEGTEPSSKILKKSPRNKKEKKSKILNIPPAYCLVATFGDLREVPKLIVPDFGESWPHSFLIEQTRNIPLVPPDPKEELARWKRFRWLAWAIARGIYHEDNFEIIKCLKIVSIFKKFSQMNKEPSDFALDMQHTADVMDEVVESEKLRKEEEVKDHVEKKSKDHADKTSKDHADKKSKDHDKKSKDHDKKSKDHDKKSKDKDKKSSKSGKSGKSAITIPESPCLWGDFNLLQPYITELHIYTKPAIFVSNIKISDFQDKSKEFKSVITNQPTFFKRYVWPNKPNFYRNEPFHLFMDSLDYNFLMINLSQTGNKNLLQYSKRRMTKQSIYSNFRPSKISYREDEPEFNRPISHLIIEKYNWTSEQIGESLASIKTVGSKSVILQIRPGRNNLRLWIKSNESFVVQVISDVYLTAGTQEQVFEYMQNESRLLIQTSYDVGGYFGKLLQSFGEADFQDKLISFHTSYKPENSITKIEAAIIRNEFCQELYNFIREQYGPCAEYIQALRVLLIDFHNYSRLINTTGFSERVNSRMSDGFMQQKAYEKAAVKVQAFFKTIYIKSLFASRINTHPKFTKRLEFVKKIYKDFFSVEQRVNTVSSILRKILLRNHNLDQIRDCYDVYQDLQSVIHFQAIVNAVKTSILDIPSHIQNSPTISPLIPIGRHVFHVNCTDPVVLKFYIHCDCDFYCLRIFNNDTFEETKRSTLDTNVGEFSANLKGYTVLIYAISSADVPVIQSKFAIVSLKRDYKSVIFLTEHQTTLSTVCDYYIPNVKNLIGKCQLFMKSQVSFRFTSSFKNAKVKLRCLDELGVVTNEIVGEGCVILPTLNLNSRDWETSKTKIHSTGRGKISRSRSVASRDGSFTKRKRKGSEFGSVMSIRRSRKSGLNKSVSFIQPENYAIEIYVLENSWPLTYNEWLQVDEAKKRDLIGPELFPNEREINKKHSSRMLDTMFKRSRTNVDTREPFWCIQVIHNKTDEVHVMVDRRRQEQIKDIKRSWFENDVERYNQAIEIRKAYLESQYALMQDTTLFELTSYNSEETYYEETEFNEILILNENEIVLEEETNQFMPVEEEEETTDLNLRTLKKPISVSKILPPLDFTTDALVDEEMLENVSELNLHHVDTLLNLAKLKTADDVIDDEERLENAKEDFIKYIDEFNETTLNMRIKGVDDGLLIENWFQECRDESEVMLKDAYSIKEQYMALNTEPVKKKEKGKKGKDKKKKK